MKKLKKPFVLFILVIMLIIPFQLIGQEANSIIEEAWADAEADAKKDVKKDNWLVFGFFVPIFGVGVAYLFTPPQKDERLIGKSSEYVQAYTDAYKSEKRRIQTSYASLGCMLTGLTAGCTFIFIKEWSTCGSNYSGCSDSDGYSGD